MEEFRNAKKLAGFIGKIALEKKGSNIIILDVRKISSMVDFFVMITGLGEKHSKAIADDIVDTLNKKGMRKWHLEGYSYGHWILIDYVDVVVHIFVEEERKFYDLESLWGDAPMEKIGEVDAKH